MAKQSVSVTAPGILEEMVERRAREMGGSEYLVSARSGRVVTYLELALRAKEWRGRLARLGVAPGDRVGLLIADPVDFATTFIGLLANGVWVAPLDPALGDLSSQALDARLVNLHLRGVVSDRDAPADVQLDWIALSPEGTSFASTVTLTFGPVADNGGIVLASSGTTGAPKVVLLSNQQLLHAAALIARHNELNIASRGFNPLPLWHINAEVVAVLSTLVAGSSIVLDDHFHRTDFWATVDRVEATWINAVPAIIARLATLREGEVVPSRVQFVRSASAPLAPSVLDRFEKTTGLSVIETYGMTEAASQICANPLAGPRKVGSVGRPVGVELRIRPIDDGDGGGGDDPVVGEVEIRGPSVIERYESDALNDRFDEEGWLSTGDLGYLDSDGYLFLVGRRDDVINRSGEKIFPREIEEVVLNVKGVGNAAVIAMADEVFGQVPALYIQAHSSVDPLIAGQLDALIRDVRDAVTAAFDRSRRPVEIVIIEQMPLHATGKIQKKSLTSEAVVVIARADVA
ncbi:MAG TPA: AMP-binding protein [Acidimicrobiales bacterium]|nr:AMP-binding protein [Acidimicrobiales bacterium]